MLENTLPTTPGALLGYTRRGPFYLMAGGSEGAPEPGPAGDQPQNAPQPPAPTPPAEPGPAPDAERVNPDARRVDELPSWGQKLIKDLRKESGDYRAQLKAAQDAADAAAKAQGPSADEVMQQAQQDFAKKIGKALGLIQDEEKPVDPKVLIDQLTTEKDQTAKERDAERELHRRALVELAVHRQSTKAGADPDALLDSRSFLRNIKEFDPNADDFAEKLTEVITKAVEDNPKFKAASLAGPPAKSGGEFTGGPGGRSSDPEQMNVDDFRARRKKPSSS
ncbi:hypothetical protein ACWEN6_13580 [Sphaerisporangium sp. NPDC004334]